MRQQQRRHCLLHDQGRRWDAHGRRVCERRRQQRTVQVARRLRVHALVLVAPRGQAALRRLPVQQPVVHGVRLAVALAHRRVGRRIHQQLRGQRTLQQTVAGRLQHGLGGQVVRLKAGGQRLAGPVRLLRRVRRLLEEDARVLLPARREPAHLEELGLQALLGGRALAAVPAEQTLQQLVQLEVQVVLLPVSRAAHAHLVGLVAQLQDVVGTLVHRLCDDVVIPLHVILRSGHHPQEKPAVSVIANACAEIKVVHLLSLLLVTPRPLAHDEQRQRRISQHTRNQTELL